MIRTTNLIDNDSRLRLYWKRFERHGFPRMYVCLCNGVSERHLREAVATGATSFEALQERLEVSTCCGCCEEEVRAILADCIEDKPVRHLRIVNDNHPAHAA